MSPTWDPKASSRHVSPCGRRGFRRGLVARLGSSSSLGDGPRNREPRAETGKPPRPGSLNAAVADRPHGCRARTSLHQRPRATTHVRSSGEPLAAAGAPGRDDLAPAHCRHPRAESMPALAHELARLICPLHASSPFENCGRRGSESRCRSRSPRNFLDRPNDPRPDRMRIAAGPGAREGTSFGTRAAKAPFGLRL